jgi:hypothetical protein
VHSLLSAKRRESISQLVKFSVLVGIRMRSTEAFNVEIGAALLRFNEEAVLYCRGISDADAHACAMDYARMLRSRAKGLEFERTDFSAHLLEPNRNSIEGTLDRMYSKYFATYRVASKLP